MAAAVGEAIALVGPATEAITKIIDVGKDIAGLFGGGSVGGSSDAVNNVIQVGTGSFSGGSQDNLDGDPLVISGYLGTGEYIGTGHMPGHMEQGTPSTTTLDNSGNNGDQQAMQILVQQGGSDAVCISYIQVLWLQEVWSGWSGDWGRMCKQDWYYSRSTWGKQADGTAYVPNCMWIDGGKGKKHQLEEFLINLNYMLGNGSTGIDQQGDPNKTATYCDSAFKFSSDTTNNHNVGVPNGLNGGAVDGAGPERRDRIKAVPGKHHSGSVAPYPTGTKGAAPFATGTATGTAAITSATGTLKTKSGMETQLVVSDFDHHSAIELCEHPRSYGPDFVSLAEGVFCDMSERKHYPLCSKEVTKDCFSVDKATKKVHKRDGASRQGDQQFRSYGDVHTWHKDQ